MAKSPLLIGSDVRSINASSLAILKNKDLIACEPPTLLLGFPLQAGSLAVFALPLLV